MSEESDPTGSGFPPWPSARQQPNRLLLWCIAASIALHALLIAGLPRFGDKFVAPPVQVLEVVLVTAEPPAAPPTAESAPGQAAQAQRPTRMVPERERAPTPRAVPAPPVTKPVATVKPPAPAALAPSEPPAQPVARSTAPSAPEPAIHTQPQAIVPAPATPPHLNAAHLQNPPPRYPLVARRRGEEGTVTLRVHVQRDGVPASVGLEKSSGSNALDNAALEAVRAWRFAPARQGEEAVDAWVLVPIVFRLEGAS